VSVVTDLFASLVERLVLPRLDPLALYPARVVSQQDDGSLDVKPDDTRWGPGLSRVPIRHGLPGVNVRVRQGARVLVGFEGGDITRPFASLWEPGSLDTLTIEASVKLLLKAPSVVAAEVEGNARPVARLGDLVKVTGISGAPGVPIEFVGYILDGAKKVTAE
jgi:hypothetical protein